MADADERVKQAVSAFKAGKKAEARSILESVVDENEGHEEAWLYLSALVDSLEEQEICLENVLALNPNNQKAKKGLETVRQKMAAEKKSPPSPIDAGFEAASGHSPFGSAPPAQPPSPFSFGAEPTTPPPDQVYDWFSGPAAPDQKSDRDSYEIPTSVDWGHDDKPATYGSGQNVEMPSAQEWDSWVQGLNIGKDQPETPALPAADIFDSSASPFLAEDSAPFGETGYMVDDEDTGLMSPVSPGSVSAPFGDSSAWATPFGDEIAADDVQAEETFPAYEAANAAPSPFASGSFDTSAFYEEEEVVPTSRAFTFDADEVEIGEDELVFDFDDDDEDDLDVEPTSKGKASAQAAGPRPGAEYFRQIPGEIEAKASGIEQRSLMMLGGIAVLVVLNAISFAMLLM